MSKTFTAKIHLDDKQIREVIAAYFGVPEKNVIVDVDWQGIEIEKEIEVPEQAKPILHPAIIGGKSITDETLTRGMVHAEWTNADALTNAGITEG